MSQVLEVGLKDIVLANSSFGPQEIDRLTQSISDDYLQFGSLRDAVHELESRDRTPASAVRLGVCYYLLGRFNSAVETLSKADGGALAHFYLGRSRFALGQYDAAIACYKSAKTAGFNADDCALATAESLRNKGDAAAAMQSLDQLFGPVEQTAEYLYQRGATVASLNGSPNEVVALYKRAFDADETHPGALFGLAIENDRRGNDEEALMFYERAVNCFPTFLGTLLNLGVLYEDRQQFEKAQLCYHRILDSYPDHERARLYLKDAAAASNVLFDEDLQKRTDRISQVLNVPVTDFELSVRARNCLQKMGVQTLGDLTRITEQDLLASKNFGETSLYEIREILRAKGLELGMFANEKGGHVDAPLDTAHLTPDEQIVLDKPIAELNLSVRARKCMARLGINTIGELVRKTSDDLLECKNFGVTSLNEVKEKLTSMVLKLRGD